MGDPRLNSIHLEDPRRHEFRRAREALLGARGDCTRLADAGSKTAVQALEGCIPASCDCVVMDREQVYPLKVGLNTIGRLPDNDVVLADPYVSRRHCAILVHASKGFELHDVASKNGTFLNGRRLTGPTPIVSGDEIRMCDRHLIFVRRGDLPEAVGDRTFVE
jgi:hypothetical protein